MVQENISQTITLPEGVTGSASEGTITIKGEKGEVSRLLLHPKVTIAVNGNDVVLHAIRFSRFEKKIMNTYVAHVNNMVKGVTEGHTYKLKICSGHFPMNVSLKGSTFEVKNFIGEAVPRRYEIKEGAKVKVDGDIVVVDGIDKELVAQTAASIEKLTRRSGFDRRIFQDGIYIIEKDGKAIPQ